MGRSSGRYGTMALVGELAAFMWMNKRWWLMPAVIALLVLACLIVFAETSALAPFLYTVF